MMAVVAVAALLILTVIWIRKSNEHRTRASYYKVRETNNRNIAATQSALIQGRTELVANIEQLLAGKEEADPVRAAKFRDDLARERDALASTREQRDLTERRIAFLVKMRLKHQRAARYPWLPVAPDPPEP
jgi:hypothetical protein